MMNWIHCQCALSPYSYILEFLVAQALPVFAWYLNFCDLWNESKIFKGWKSLKLVIRTPDGYFWKIAHPFSVRLFVVSLNVSFVFFFSFFHFLETKNRFVGSSMIQHITWKMQIQKSFLGCFFSFMSSPLNSSNSVASATSKVSNRL